MVERVSEKCLGRREICHSSIDAARDDGPTEGQKFESVTREEGVMIDGLGL